MMGHRKGSKVESPNPDNQQNGAPRGDLGPTHASGPPGENNRWLRSVRENSSEITKIIDLSGVLHYANPAAHRHLLLRDDGALDHDVRAAVRARGRRSL